MVNRVIGRRPAKKQPMRWSRRGAHLLVQIRVAVLDGRLEQVFQQWYPRFRPLAPPPKTTTRFLPLSIFYLITTALGGEAIPPSTCSGVDTTMNSYRRSAAQSWARGASTNNSPSGRPSSGSAR